MKFKVGDRCRIVKSERGSNYLDKVGTVVEIKRGFQFNGETEYETSIGRMSILESRLELVSAT